MKRIRNTVIIFTLALGCAITSSFAVNPQPPPTVSICDFSDEWVEKNIEVDGVLTHFKIPSDSPPATSDLKLTSESCAKSKPILVTLSYCGSCECWETKSEEIWTVIKRLRAADIKSAKIKTRGKIEKTNDQNFRYLFKVGCIQRIVAE